jgi:hypothetical protein
MFGPLRAGAAVVNGIAYHALRLSRTADTISLGVRKQSASGATLLGSPPRSAVPAGSSLSIASTPLRFIQGRGQALWLFR